MKLSDLAASGATRIEYGMHAVWTDPDGTTSEDWMTCRDEEQLRYVLRFWRSRGWVCTPLTRTVTTSGWLPPMTADQITVDGSPAGCWVAFNWDGSAFVPFATELEALRYASSYLMVVKFARFGDEDWRTRPKDAS